MDAISGVSVAAWDDEDHDRLVKIGERQREITNKLSEHVADDKITAARVERIERLLIQVRVGVVVAIAAEILPGVVGKIAGAMARAVVAP